MNLTDEATAWTDEHWESHFGKLGSYDFAREAYTQGAIAAAAAERERIRQLARERRAACVGINDQGHESGLIPFADLLGGETP